MKAKTAIFGIIMGLYAQGLLAQVCSNPLNVIYGLDQKGNIVPITVSNASVGSSLTSSSDAGYPGSTTNSNSIGLDIQTSTFYFFQNNSSGSQKFVSFNALTNTYTTLANSPITSSTVKGCVTADGTGYYCIDGNNNLCYYNIATNKWTKIGSNLQDPSGNSLSSTFSSLGSGDMAIDGLGRLWIIVSSSSYYGLYLLPAPLPTTATSPIVLTQIIAPTQPTPSGSPFGGIAYNASGEIYMSTVNDLYLLQSNLTLSHVGSFSTSGVGADLTSCNYPLSVLPVSWVNFSASLQQNNTVLLTWTLDQQVNNEGYNIQRSSDGDNWQNIGFGATEPGETSITYSFTDTSPLTGTNFYRIQALDRDGNSSYSNVKAVTLQNGNLINIWPIPAKGIINIRVPGSSTGPCGNFAILTPSGEAVKSGSLNTGINTIDIGSLLTGTYIVHVVLNNGTTSNQRLVKL